MRRPPALFAVQAIPGGRLQLCHSFETAQTVAKRASSGRRTPATVLERKAATLPWRPVAESTWRAGEPAHGEEDQSAVG